MNQRNGHSPHLFKRICRTQSVLADLAPVQPTVARARGGGRRVLKIGSRAKGAACAALDDCSRERLWHKGIDRRDRR
jgi:hypothetical protein